MYDLTAILTTIAACSASLVAILGGFIASRLISLNTERNEVQARLSEIADEIDFHEKKRDTVQAELDEDDALDFVKENIESIIEEVPLEEVYKAENRPRLEKDVLNPYWKRAAKVLQVLYDDMQERSDDDEYVENEDGIPVTVARALTNDFEYETCRQMIRYFNSKMGGFPNYVSASIPEVGNGYWYAKSQETVNVTQVKIDWLLLHRNQLLARCKALERPKGMAGGLLLFSVFSAINIILPLYLSPFLTDNLKLYANVKISAIVSFAIGLVFMLIYLSYLLYWPKKEQIKDQKFKK